MHSMDVSLSWLAYSYVSFPCHVISARTLVCSRSRFVCFLTLPIWIDDLSPVTYLSYAFPLRLVDSSMLTFLTYAYPFRLNDSSTELLFLDSDSLSIYGSYLSLRTYVIVSRSSLYIWVGDGDSLPIFNLLCNHPKGATCEIPRTLPRPL